MKAWLLGGVLAASLGAVSPALADVALDPDDEIEIAQNVIAERNIACGNVVGTRSPEPAENERLREIGYRWRWMAVCSNGTRVVLGRNLRRGLTTRPPRLYLRVIPRGRR